MLNQSVHGLRPVDLDNLVVRSQSVDGPEMVESLKCFRDALLFRRVGAAEEGAETIAAGGIAEEARDM